MALQASGAISMSQINTELQRSASAQISLDTAENGGYAAINQCSSSRPNSNNPASMSEWYSYNHTINCCGGATCYTHSGYSLDSSCAGACSGGFTNTYYSCCSSLGVGCRIYTGACTWNTGTTITGYISNGTTCYTVNAGMIDAVANCATCPAPTITGYTRCSTYVTLSISYTNCTNMEVEYSSNGGSTWTTEGNTGCVTTKYVYNLSPSTTYLFRARVWCAATASWSNKSNIQTITTCAANGTYVTQFCSGGALYYTYADGCCGTYNTLINSCDSSCGCSSYDLYYADVYTCPGCIYQESIVVAFPTGTTVNVGKFYKSASDPNNGYIYNVTGSTTGSTGYILTTPGYNNCIFACPTGEV